MYGRRSNDNFEQPKNPFGQKGPTDQGNTNRSWLIMRKNPLNKGVIMENAAGIGTVTSEMVEARARELAAINGRPSSEPSQADYQQAKRELTGEAETDPQDESSESIPESEGWDPVPGSTGRQAADSLGEDEDAEGRSESAQLFEEDRKSVV